MNKTLEPVRHGPAPSHRRSARAAGARLSSSAMRGCVAVVYALLSAGSGERGEGAIVEDVDGNRFLDFNAGIAVVATGHCHPRVVDAIQKQAARLIHMSGTDFYYEEMVTLAEKLAEIAPGDVPRRVSFGNSGAEAIEGAIKLARWSTKRDKIIAFFGSFPRPHHGSALAHRAQERCSARASVRCCPGWCTRPIPTATAARSASQEETCAVECVRTSRTCCSRPSRRPGDRRHRGGTGAGRRRLRGSAEKFFDELTRVARQNGILLVCDEVQSGMGRTGKMWAASISTSRRTFSRWPRESPAACRWGPPSRAPT
jgi:4-aminobutyrate aminotransferase